MNTSNVTPLNTQSTAMVPLSEFIPGEGGALPARNGFFGVPKKTEHCFDREIFRALLWFELDDDDDYLLLVGPMGTGKTSTVQQFYSRLNGAVYQFNATNTSECNDLLGQWVMGKDGMDFIEGPLTKAAREGAVLLINEFDMMPPGEQVGFNDIFGDGFIRLPMKGGEEVAIEDGFKVIITANHMGVGGDRASYAGVFPVNQSVLDRCRIFKADYMDPKVEEQVLHHHLDKKALLNPQDATLADTLRVHIPKMVALANEVRASYKAMLSQEGSFDNATVSLPLSTRSLLRWTTLALRSSAADNPLAYALERAFSYRLPEEEQEAVKVIGDQVFGKEMFTKPAPQKQGGGGGGQA